MHSNNPTTNKPKQIVCVRVDGASDEGPSHLKVQFWWTEFHMTNSNYITFVSTRSSGSSYLNRVELQNGCLSQAHSNIFIPSTIKGSCTSESGVINQVKLKQTLEAATDVYINRCDQCPCGDTVIHLYKGADSSILQDLRALLHIFLKGSQEKKRQLSVKNPQAWSFFNSVWTVRENHCVPGLPETYLFFLKCCLKPECLHPLCQQKQIDTDIDIPTTWYPGGPPTSYLPLPVADPNRPWGNVTCEDCKGTCHGHYLKPDESNAGLDVPAAIPSVVIQQFFADLKGAHPTDEQLLTVSKTLFFPNQKLKCGLLIYRRCVTIEKEEQERLLKQEKRSVLPSSRLSLGT